MWHWILQWVVIIKMPSQILSILYHCQNIFILQRYDVPATCTMLGMKKVCFENCSFSMVGLSMTCLRPTETVHVLNTPITLRPRIPRISKNWQFSGFVVELLSVREVSTSFVYIRSEFRSIGNSWQKFWTVQSFSHELPMPKKIVVNS